MTNETCNVFVGQNKLISQVTLPALQRISQAKQLPISQVTLPALQRISQAKQPISQVTLPALQRIFQAKQPISQVMLPRPLSLSKIMNCVKLRVLSCFYIEPISLFLAFAFSLLPLRNVYVLIVIMAERL